MKTETRFIGGRKFTMTQLGVCTANHVALRLAKPFAGLMSKAFEAGRKAPTQSDILDGIERALTVMSGRDINFLLKKLAAKTTVSAPRRQERAEGMAAP